MTELETGDQPRSRIKSVVSNLMFLLLVLLIFGGIAMFYRVRKQRDLGKCIRNMETIEQAKLQYQRQKNLPDGYPVMRGSLDDYIAGGWDLRCPALKKDNYLLGKLGERPGCVAHGSLTDPHLPEETKD
jgi:hypothetical protein